MFGRKRPGEKMKINFITFANPTNAYSGIQYICEELVRMGFDVELSCRIPDGQMAVTRSWPFSVFSAATTWYGNTPIIRTAFYWLRILFMFARGERNFIFHEAHFFRFITLFKSLSRRTRCVHYATELYTEKDEPAHAGILAYYRRAASTPDLVVECDQQRAAYRQNEYGITSKISVIPNTLPFESNENTAPSHLEDEIVSSNQSNLPILIYSGAGYLHRELDRIIDGVSQARTSVFFVLICYGPKSELEQVRQYAFEALGPEGFLFVANASRDDIKRALNIADAGIVYYRPSLSIGNRFAAPTKFFEYVAAGVRVISSHNESLKPLIDEHRLGKYTEDESAAAIARAIDEVFEQEEAPLHSRARIREAFRQNLCFEVAAHAGMRDIHDVFARNAV
jgi:glycosyltransferase involved in cell wall biosynthesis